MARSKKYKKGEIVTALKNAHGLKTGACEILGCDYKTLMRYVERDAEAQEVIEHWRNRRLDRAEYKLDEAIERGEAWAIAMVLKDSKRGKERGYGNSMDVTSGGNAITKIEIEYVKTGNDSENKTA